MERQWSKRHWRAPICRTLQIAPSTYFDRRAIARDPDRASARAKSDSALSLKIDGAWADNLKLYGAREIWHVLRREGVNAWSTRGCGYRHFGKRRNPTQLDWKRRIQLFISMTCRVRY